MNILIDILLKQFFCIQNRKMCLSKKVFYQYFVAFYPAWDSFSSENVFICHCIALSYLKTNEVLLDADGHELT